MEYPFKDIEEKWQRYWAENGTYKTVEVAGKPKYYVLDMFPYPSGAGLHVGHPLGYIASDIVARYKRLKGFNVLHPMGYDAFGLPAEQYAIQTGQHPAITTENNVARYREQLDKIGFSFDWSREVKTSDPKYYKWTQWIFIQLFNSWYDNKAAKARKIDELIEIFSREGNAAVDAASSPDVKIFSAVEWNAMNEIEQQTLLLDYRLAYLSDTMVNWCAGLGTVLANEEVKDGVSERGGFPVERKLMKQWSLRITAYADRLLNDLEKIDWPDPVKEMQRNWIGKSEGALLKFHIKGTEHNIEVFTTRPDTIFGATYITLAPEHELIDDITAPDHRDVVKAYVEKSKNRSERDRISDVKTVSGVDTGAFAINPFTGDTIPVWTGDYVLAGYGTGAVMAVPAHDSRDYAFAKHFNLPIKEVVQGGDISKEAYEEKKGVVINSGFISGFEVYEAMQTVINKAEELGIGKRQINFRLRDAIFSRQRYWGEPFPVYYKKGIPYVLDEKDLPLELPEVDKYLPTESGEPPLARARDWNYETSTMPGWAGSSWYYLRYMDPHNENEFVSKEKADYWQDVDLYIGGAEHATGHLLYVRFWTKFLFDLGLIPKDEPAKKLINQGMIQGVSEKIKRINYQVNTLTFTKPLKRIPFNDAKRFYYSSEINDYELHEDKWYSYINVDIFLVHNSVLDIEKYISSRKEELNSVFVCEGGYWLNGKFIRIKEGSDEFKTIAEPEKMSKSKLNVVNPDDIIEQYGADTLRLYEMFLGPLELSKPWSTHGIEGVYKFIRKFWRLFHKSTPGEKQGWEFNVIDEKATKEELKTLHKTIKKIQDDIDRYSFNTCVSTFMICVNELTDLKCNKKEILEPLTITLAPFAPHVAEELWQKLGNKNSITYAQFPEYKEEFVTENSFEYPVSVNGKTRFKIELPLEMQKEEVEKAVLSSEEARKYLNGNKPKKVIVVPGRIVNIVV